MLKTAKVKLVPVSIPRPTLLDLWNQYHFSKERLAFFAGITHEKLTAMLRYEPVDYEQAKSVVSALSRLLPQPYTLGDVDILTRITPVEIREVNTHVSTK